jgi:hypothetical protein
MKSAVSFLLLALASLLAPAVRGGVPIPTPAGGAPAQAQTGEAPAAPAPIPKALLPYTTCNFPDSLRVVQVVPLDPGASSRTVQTTAGTQRVEPLAGEHILFAYPLTDFFANVKVELLPPDSYAADKKILLANMAWIESQPHGPSRAQALPVGLHDFEVHGNDRYRLEGSVLGMYLLFDDPAHVAATIQFLNQQSWQRKFQTIDQYGRLRDSFLRNYTGCIRENQAINK